MQEGGVGAAARDAEVSRGEVRTAAEAVNKPRGGGGAGRPLGTAQPAQLPWRACIPPRPGDQRTSQRRAADSWARVRRRQAFAQKLVSRRMGRCVRLHRLLGLAVTPLSLHQHPIQYPHPGLEPCQHLPAHLGRVSARAHIITASRPGPARSHACHSLRECHHSTTPAVPTATALHSPQISAPVFFQRNASRPSAAAPRAPVCVGCAHSHVCMRPCADPANDSHSQQPHESRPRRIHSRKSISHPSHFGCPPRPPPALTPRNPSRSPATRTIHHHAIRAAQFPHGT